MVSFRRVEGEQAGPEALGILVPPGRRTLVVLRPRSLDFDLLLLRDGQDLVFWEAGRGEATHLALKLRRVLEEGARGGNGDAATPSRGSFLETISQPAPDGYQLLAKMGVFRLLACRRVPGQPYQPMLFATAGEARDAAERLAHILCPRPEVAQELYFNTKNFR
ncbi:MAG: hypothetical protein JO112_03105 [Planctomycetes bacterium]|nr:hypothetical protein [Planctomycetota bacterium]